MSLTPLVSSEHCGGLDGKTVLVTGASDGIGLEIAETLARCGAQVLMPVREREKGKRAVSRIRQRIPDAQLEVLDLDLSRLSSVHALAATLMARRARIDLLMLNAGMVQLTSRERRATRDGFDLTFQTNFLGHAGLTLGILPLLRDSRARVVVQSSLAAIAAKLPWGDLRGERPGHAFHWYRASKAAMGLFARELARRSEAEDWGVSVGWCHPGISPGSAIAPEIRALLPAPLVRWCAEHLGNSPRQAASTAFAALTAPASATPSMFVPAGLGQFSGPPRERALFRSFERPGDAYLLWGLVERWCQITSTPLRALDLEAVSRHRRRVLE